MTTSFKLGKERATGKIVSIEVAARGLACDCVCDACGKKFVAAKGEKNEWHFRHYEETNCTGGQETALHKLAKQLIEKGSAITLRTYGKVLYNTAQQEVPFQTIQPDVSALTNGENIFFEVLVTHAVDTAKENFYKSGEHKSIEINLKNYSFTTEEQLRQDILENIENCRAIFWEKEPKIIKAKSNDNSFIYFLLFLLGIMTFGLVTNSSGRRRKR